MKQYSRGSLIACAVCILLAAVFLSCAVWTFLWEGQRSTPFVICMIFGCIAAALAMVFAAVYWFSRYPNR